MYIAGGEHDAGRKKKSPKFPGALNAPHTGLSTSVCTIE